MVARHNASAILYARYMRNVPARGHWTHVWSNGLDADSSWHNVKTILIQVCVAIGCIAWLPPKSDYNMRLPVTAKIIPRHSEHVRFA